MLLYIIIYIIQQVHRYTRAHRNRGPQGGPRER